MTRHEWALLLAEQISYTWGKSIGVSCHLAQWEALDQLIAHALRAEHRRAVRACQKQRVKINADGKFKLGYFAAITDCLAAIQKGR